MSSSTIQPPTSARGARQADRQTDGQTLRGREGRGGPRCDGEPPTRTHRHELVCGEGPARSVLRVGARTQESGPPALLPKEPRSQSLGPILTRGPRSPGPRPPAPSAPGSPGRPVSQGKAQPGLPDAGSERTSPVLVLGLSGKTRRLPATCQTQESRVRLRRARGQETFTASLGCFPPLVLLSASRHL